MFWKILTYIINRSILFTESKEKQICSCHQQHRMEVVLMIENYLTAIIYILLIALVITAIIAFALIVVLTIVLSKQQ